MITLNHVLITNDTLLTQIMLYFCYVDTVRLKNIASMSYCQAKWV